MLDTLKALLQSIETYLVRADGRYGARLEEFLKSKNATSPAEVEYWIQSYDRSLADRRSWIE
jgi:hypothetical protein